MLCVANPSFTVGPTANAYVFPLVSVTDCTWPDDAFHPTTTTFRSPVACAAVNGTATVATGDCGTAEFTWTRATAGAAGVVALATPEYPPRFAAASVARTR